MNVGATSRKHRVFPRDSASARAVREFVTTELRALAAPPDVVDDVRLAVSELAANAIEYGLAAEIEVWVGADTDGWEIEVVGAADPGAHLPGTERWAVAGSAATSGRGLGIVRQLMDEAFVTETGGRIAVRCVRRRRE